MQPRMTRSILQTTNCRTWRVSVSLPLIEALIDNVKYFHPREELPSASGKEPQQRPRTAPAAPGWKVWWRDRAETGS